jgi:pyruvate,water dikinase
MMSLGGKATSLGLISGIVDVPPYIVLSGDELVAADWQNDLTTRLVGAGVVPPYAVRSSAEVEDGETASFAGMFETELNISSERLVAAVERVRASISSERLTSYAESMMIEMSEAMHVIVQTMVDSRVAGVCLSRLPEVSPELGMIEAVYGLGELLVSGEVEPDSYLVERGSGNVQSSQVGNQMLLLTIAEGRQMVPAHRRRAQKLTNSEIGEIWARALELEASLDYVGVDMEWAFAENKLWVLQARPVTTITSAM